MNDELNMDCQDVEKFYPYNKPVRADGENYESDNFDAGYNRCCDDVDKYLECKLNNEILSDVLYHIMTAEGIEFCEKDTNNIAEGIKKWMEENN